MTTHIPVARNPLRLFIGALVFTVVAACTDTHPDRSQIESSSELPPVPTVETGHLSEEVRVLFADVQAQLKSTPLDGHYNSRFARLLHAYSLHAPAAIMYERCRLLRPSDLECLYLEALTLRQLGNNEEAIDLLQTLVERKPAFPRAQTVLAAAYRDQGQTDLALPLFERAVKSDRKNLEAVYGLAMSVMESGNLERARELLESLHQNGRQFGIVHAALATLNRQEGAVDAAAFHAAAASRFTDAKIPFVDSVLWNIQDEQIGDARHVREARAHFKAGRLGEAARSYESAITANPDNASSHASLVGIYAELGNLAGARRHLITARELNPADVMPIVSLGTVFMKRGDFANAQALFKEAIALQPTHAEARTLAAYCSELLGAPVEPEEYRQALQDDPTQTLAHYLFGRYLMSTQNCATALPNLRSSVLIESARTPAFVPDLVRCLAEAEEIDEARRTLASGQELARHYGNASAARALEQVALELGFRSDGASGDQARPVN